MIQKVKTDKNRSQPTDQVTTGGLQLQRLERDNKERSNMLHCGLCTAQFMER